MGVDAQEFPGGLLRLDPTFVYAEPPSSWPLPWVEFLTLAPSIPIQVNSIIYILKENPLQSFICEHQLEHEQKFFFFFLPFFFLFFFFNT